MNKLLGNKVSLILILFIVTFIFTLLFNYFTVKSKSLDKSDTTVENSSLPKMSALTLKEFDGSDNSKPIYIALNGKVYDVSEGRKFYETGGTYHYLAGRDSSKELNIIGGAIIEKKYRVIAILSD